MRRSMIGSGNRMSYQQELFAQKTPYLQWLKEQEQRGNQPEALGKHIQTLPFSSCMDTIPCADNMEVDGIYLCVKTNGILTMGAAAEIQRAFLEQKDAVLVYADEDYRGSLKELYGIEDGVFDEEITEPYRYGDAVHYRGNPWFKPDFSPDTLASFFYIGSIFAIRGDAFRETVAEYGKDISFYELVYRIFMRELQKKTEQGRHGIVHLPRVLYTNNNLDEEHSLESSDRIKVLFANQTSWKKQAEYGNKIMADIYENPSQHAKGKVSVIIPSKDNAQVLYKCIASLNQYTAYHNYELILVDNGSSTEQQMWITRYLDRLKTENAGNAFPLEITYLYEEMDFNFSKMCNLGARAAKGDYLLFLNDDIEIMDTEQGRKWLDYMLFYAAKCHVGAVGAKLYYPEPERILCETAETEAVSGEASGLESTEMKSTEMKSADTKISDRREDERKACYRIQHAGITNMGIGPAHKLGGMPDLGCLYHGHNTQNYDMLAVTGACMLMRRSVFEEAGGFDESLAVAYNDVELCFRLYEAGLFNVQVNDAALIHHESLSRGADTSQEKQKRLNIEKQRLYEKHPALKNKDPFYSPNLVQWKKDTDYNTAYLYECDKIAKPRLPGAKEKQAILKQYDFRRSLSCHCKPVRKLYDKLKKYHLLQYNIEHIEESDGLIMITGWHLELNRDNADLPKKLWLMDMTRNENYRTVYEFDVMPKLREDVAAVFSEGTHSEKTKNTALSGIQLCFEKTQLHQGSYAIGILTDKKRLICIEQTGDEKAYVEINYIQKGVIQDGR